MVDYFQQNYRHQIKYNNRFNRILTNVFDKFIIKMLYLKIKCKKNLYYTAVIDCI